MPPVSSRSSRTAKGVTIRHWLKPRALIAEGGKVAAIELEYTRLEAVSSAAPARR